MAINDLAKLDALDALDEVLDLIAKSEGKGATFHQCAAALGVNYNRVYLLATRLEELGKIRIVRGQGNYLRLLYPDDPRLDETRLHTPWQEKVLAFLCERADERGLVHASIKEISQGVGHPSSCSGSISALECRGFLEILHRGGPTRPRLYQVFKNGDGPKGYSAVWFSTQAAPYLESNKEEEHEAAE